MLPDRANLLCLLKILEEYSDSEHILPMREIIGKMKSIYDIDIARRAVYSAIELLKQMGYDISTYEENGRGYYLRSRQFEPSELRLLTDAVFSFPFIAEDQSSKLIEKLQSTGSVHQRKRYRNLSVPRAAKKTRNKQVFLNIELLDEAIGTQRKVHFTYLTYDARKDLTPRREEPYTVSPYRMVYTNEHYYLACRLSGYTDTSFYRIDRMRDISIDEDTAEMPQEGLSTLVDSAVYAFSGFPEKVMFAFEKSILNDVIDRFGPEITLTEEGDRFLARIEVPPQGVRFWALQYLPYVEVIEPSWLREQVIDSIRANRYGV